MCVAAQGNGAWADGGKQKLRLEIEVPDTILVPVRHRDPRSDSLRVHAHVIGPALGGAIFTEGLKKILGAAMASGTPDAIARARQIAARISSGQDWRSRQSAAATTSAMTALDRLAAEMAARAVAKQIPPGMSRAEWTKSKEFAARVKALAADPRVRAAARTRIEAEAAALAAASDDLESDEEEA